jgi:uncharacterized phiE125 gp8 family phage protein
MALIVKADVKSFLGIKSADTSQDAAIDALIPQAQAKAEEYCDRLFDYNATEVEYLDGDGTDIAQVKRYPVKAITGIYVDSLHVFGAGTQLSSSDILALDNLKTGKLVLINGACFFEGQQTVKVAYSGGYGTGGTAVPESLKLAICKLVAADLLQGRTSVNAQPGESISYTPASMRKSAYETLDQYINYAGGGL